jgi:hypothetical protein
MTYKHLLLVGAMVVGGVPSVGRADTVCGSTSAGWNVPYGATAFIQGPGPIKDVLTAVGEYRSHSMLSHGPGGWVTHSTSVTPPASSDRGFCGSECANPIDANFLHNSMPGLETVNQGAIYNFIYGGSGNSFIAYQNGGANANALGNVIWSSQFSQSGYGWWDWSDSSNTVYGLAYNGSKVHYGWNQYMNLQNAAHGQPGLDTGLVCSTSLATWQHVALSGTAGYSGDVAPRTYPSISGAANALYNSVYNECEGVNGFFSSLGSALQQIGMTALCGTCGAGCALCGIGIGCGNMPSYDGDPCDEAADQVVNTFATNSAGYGDNCNYDNEYRWKGVAANSSATSASPDDVACWNGNGTGAPCSGSGSSIWGYDVNQTVQWNSGGSQYGCWD